MADPKSAAEMERIGQLMLQGEESENDLIRLVELLMKSGELVKAESILVANSTHGDRLHALHRELFKNAEDSYNVALKLFSDQLGFVLSFIRSPRAYCDIYKCKIAKTNEKCNNINDATSEVKFTYIPGLGVVADLYQDIEGNPNSIPLSFRLEGSRWGKDNL